MTIFLARPEPIGDGIALAVKDLFDTAGLRTTYGSTLFAEHVPDRTAAAVARLEAAGYVTVGKTNLHEFAYGITSYNPHFGTVPNPLMPGRIAGGSSGGSAAALAAGLADAALGTDTGGSIRIPSGVDEQIHEATEKLADVRQALVGSVATAVMHNAGRPVAVVPESFVRGD